MITRENWKEIITKLFQKHFDTNIYELRFDKHYVVFRYKESKILGFGSIRWFGDGVEEKLHITVGDDLKSFIAIVDEIHLEEVIKYISIMREEYEQRVVITNYESNLGLQRDLKITNIFED